MNLGFLGAAREVTGSSDRVEAEGLRFLVDCDVFQGGREARETASLYTVAQARHCLKRL